MSLDTVTLDDALKLLTLPRELGELDDEPITVQNGRYGPYVKKGTDSRSLETEEQLFTLTLAEAKDLFAQPKARGRGARASAPPLRELGDDPATGKPMVIKDGRFGPYVTDGETNASLRKGDEVESITVEPGGRAARRPPRRAAHDTPADHHRPDQYFPAARRPRRTNPRPRPSPHGQDRREPEEGGQHGRRRSRILIFRTGRTGGMLERAKKHDQGLTSYAATSADTLTPVNFRAGEKQRGADGGTSGTARAPTPCTTNPACCRSSRSGGCGSRFLCPVLVTGSASSR